MEASRIEECLGYGKTCRKYVFKCIKTKDWKSQLSAVLSWKKKGCNDLKRVKESKKQRGKDLDT